MSSAGPPQGTLLNVDLGALPAPEETAFATACSIIDYGLYLEFFFWYNRPKGRATPVLSVMSPIDAVVAYLWGTTRDYQKLDEDLYTSIGISIVEVVPAQPQVESPRVVGANIYRIARTGVDAVVEFYYLSATAAHEASLKRKTTPALEPVIRVQLPGPVLTGILERVDTMVSELRGRVKALLPEVIRKA